ncbi:unnamed protein product [Mytilus coruscus]|uniref:Helix-turn-helix domain-containing protein n=1 Tax=Mytilus coruscus TaxID=42192 RepID=A0A6J8B0G6_MYTCO|nr:unnamed protein product [Mytilus coruscus]
MQHRCDITNLASPAGTRNRCSVSIAMVLLCSKPSMESSGGGDSRKRITEFGILDVPCYTNPTDKFQYLHRSSSHDKNCFSSVIKGEETRILRNTSSKDEFNKRIKLFIDKLSRRGYTNEVVSQIFHKIRHEDRQLKLRKKQYNNKITGRSMFITTYHYNAEYLKKITTKLWYIIQKDPISKQIFKSKADMGIKNNKNISDMIINH